MCIQNARPGAAGLLDSDTQGTVSAASRLGPSDREEALAFTGGEQQEATDSSTQSSVCRRQGHCTATVSAFPVAR